MLVKNTFFENELESVVRVYPQLTIKETENGHYLKGILDIPDEDNKIVGSFAVEIFPTANFPYCFPKLFEVGGDIPCEANWHKYSDNSCCLTVSANEILLCKNGMSIVRFIKEVTIPYFANQLYRKREGKYLKEYSHGALGVQEFYTDLFRTKDRKIWEEILKTAMGKIKYERNKFCYCGSKTKYKKCHLLIENKLKDIGWEQIKKDFKLIGLL